MHEFLDQPPSVV